MTLLCLFLTYLILGTSKFSENYSDQFSDRFSGNRSESDLCESCLFVVKQLQDIIEDPKSRDQFKSMLLDTCNLCPSSYGNKTCKMIVEHYFDQLVEFILDKDPHTVCSDLFLCHSQSDHVTISCPHITLSPNVNTSTTELNRNQTSFR